MPGCSILWIAVLFIFSSFHFKIACSVKHFNFGKSKWYFLGPWIVGKNELDGDPIASQTGGIIKAFYDKANKIKYFSEMATGGKVMWSKLHSDANSGTVYPKPKNIDWQRNVQTLSSVETSEWQGWAVTKFKKKKEGNFDIACSGVSTFYLNDLHPLNGDMFRTGLIWNSVKILKGSNILYVRLKMKGGHGQFKCEYKKTPRGNAKRSPFRIFKPKHVPDLLNDFDSNDSFKLMGSLIAIPTVNHGNKGRDIIFKTSSTQIDILKNDIHNIDFITSHVGPSQTTALPLTIKLMGTIKRKDCPVSFSIVGYDSINQNLKTKPVDISLRCRLKNESFLFSYEDHDGSVSIAAAIAPLKPRRVDKKNIECAYSSSSLGTPCPTILSLHGTGVDVQMSADSFKYKDRDSTDSTPYIFGVENAWLIAATRGGAHNWEYTGYLAAIRALKALPSILSENVPTLPGIDINRVLYEGHSMGGHGSWVLLARDTDRAIGMVSIAGWVRKEAYGDSNRFLLHDIGHSYIDAAMKNIVEATFSEYSIDLYSSNFVGLPILIRVGENDFSVPPWYSRKMFRLIKEHGSTTVIYDEVKGKSHWFWDTLYPNDGGVMNDEKMRQFYKSIIQDGLQPLPRFPQKIIHTVSNPASSEGRGGFQVIQQIISYRMSRVHIEKKELMDRNKNKSKKAVLLQIKTENVKKLRVKLESLERYFAFGETEEKNESIKISIDDNEKYIKINVKHQGFLDLCYKQFYSYDVETGNNYNDYYDSANSDINSNNNIIYMWVNCTSISTFGERAPSTYGPARQVFASPFIVIVGTNATKTKNVNNNLLEAGGRYIANLHYASTDTRTILYRDFEVSNIFYFKYVKRKMLNMILVGGPDVNDISKRFYKESKFKLPVFFEGSFFYLGKCKFDHPGHGVITVLPFENGEDGNNSIGLILLVAGTDTEGLRIALRLAEPTIPPMMRSPFSNQIPDFIVTGPETDAKGLGGFVSLGFFDSNWGIDASSSYGVENCI